MTFLTFHILHPLPLHNLNRDQSGLPKSQFDGGVQRGRLSAQALKRAARVDFLTTASIKSIRTRDAVKYTVDLATTYAADSGLEWDPKEGRKAVKKIIDGLVKKADTDAAKEATVEDAEDAEESGDNILFFSEAELSSLAAAAVLTQAAEEELTRDEFLRDASSPSLDVAAFGRMFAMATDVGTHAAIAVSHAATTHQMPLITDYFTAVEELAQGHHGAAHIGMTYYTSGVYYRTFTVDVDQLKRSWSGYALPGATEELTKLLKALVRALPSGRVTNSNSHTTPALVIAEVQHTRVAYAFDTPVQAGPDGGYYPGSVEALAKQRALATRFDPDNVPTAVVWGDDNGNDLSGATPVDTINDLIAFAVNEVQTS